MSEKQITPDVISEPSDTLDRVKTVDIYDPSKWYNKRLFNLQPYSSGLVQTIMVSFVCFMCPGMFNALSGLGGAGLSDPDLANKANTALNSTFATVGFFSGTIMNTLGPVYCLAFGGSGYSIYIAAFLCYKHTENEGFIVFSGAWLGICAACLWAAASTLYMSYPTEDKKGTFVFIFWCIFNLGGVIGSLIPLGQNLHRIDDTSVADGTYVGFLVLTIIGFILSFFLLPIKNVRRSDGSKIIHQKHPTFFSEMMMLFKTLKKEPWILFLFPMFFSSNWFYTYEQSDFNTTHFNIRTRSLNSLLFWLMQMIGALAVSVVVDSKKFSRKSRGLIGWALVFAVTHIIWGCGYIYEKGQSRNEVIADPVDFNDGRYIGPMFLYMFYGFYDSVYQCFAYWIMGALTNSSRKAAIYAGYYKGLQSAGAAVAWGLDDHKKPYSHMFGSSWGLLAVSLVIAFPVLFYKIEETTPIEKDLKDSDETYEDILDRDTNVVPVDSKASKLSKA